MGTHAHFKGEYGYQPRGHGGFKAHGVHIKPTAKAVGGEKGKDSAFFASRVLNMANRHHKAVQAYHAAKTPEDKAKAALLAQSIIKKQRAALKNAKAAAKTEEDLKHAQAAELIVAHSSALHDGDVVQSDVKAGQKLKAEGKKEAKPKDDDDEDEGLPDGMDEQDGGTGTLAAKSAAADATSKSVEKAYQIHGAAVAASNHTFAAKIHQEAVDAAYLLNEHDAAKHHEDKVDYHKKMAALYAKEASGHGFDKPKTATDALGTHTVHQPKPPAPIVPVPGGKPKSPEELVAQNKKEIDGAALQEDASKLIKEAKASAEEGDHVQAAGKYEQAHAKAKEAMALTAHPDKTSQVYPKAAQLAAKAKSAKWAAEQAIAKAQEEQAIADAENATGYKHENVSVFRQRREAYGSALPGPEHAAVYEYTGGAYRRINGPPKGLRGGTPQGSEQTLESEVLKMDAALARPEAAAPMDMMVYRGFTGASFYAGAGVGSVFQDHAFQSTSVDPNRAFGGDVKLHISVPKGHPAAPVPSQVPTEVERLLPRGQRYEITKMETISGRLHLHVRALPHGPQDLLGHVTVASGNAGLAQESK